MVGNLNHIDGGKVQGEKLWQMTKFGKVFPPKFHGSKINASKHVSVNSLVMGVLTSSCSFV